MTTPAFDQDQAHKHYSSACFNAAWDLMSKENRTAPEDQLLVATAQASLYHWMHRPDCTDRHLSIGFWQASRVHAVLGHAVEAARLATLCHGYSAALPPFYKGYAEEALARAAALGGDAAARDRHLEAATALAAEVVDAEERGMLESDLSTIIPAS